MQQTVHKLTTWEGFSVQQVALQPDKVLTGLSMVLLVFVPQQLTSSVAFASGERLPL